MLPVARSPDLSQERVIGTELPLSQKAETIKRKAGYALRMAPERVKGITGQPSESGMADA
ncbi:hypothetical protein BGX29_005128 [Mortierella sp. GBA35]|nr:hypothetical protein BGX29_005128 [Mortierella sp. GBA35]KAG0220303.1 hypothetical protein BGX33_003563 [Mortierella sp. NVP41]